MGDVVMLNGGRTLTYISLFSAAGVGCHGFSMEGYECIATNELIKRRLDVQKANGKCRFEMGYIEGDISQDAVKEQIYAEVARWQKLGNDRVDVLMATPPCQGISVINHKKKASEIKRNSLVIESVEIISRLRPRARRPRIRGERCRARNFFARPARFLLNDRSLLARMIHETTNQPGVNHV